MRIAVVIPAYHRPLSLLTCIGALDALASGQHSIEYRAAVDADDPEVSQALHDVMHDRITLLRAPAAPTLGRKTNDALRGVEADAFCWLADDVLPIAADWDDVIAHCIGAMSEPAFCWQELGDPSNTTYPVISRRFLDALDGKLFSEHFPFWFVDTWLAEVYLFAFGKSLPIVRQLPLAGKRGKSTNLRELAFWFEFFAATRPERLRQATGVREVYGLASPDLRALVSVRETWDAAQAQRVPEYEKAFGAGGEPGPRYLLAKAAALKVLCAQPS